MEVSLTLEDLKIQLAEQEEYKFKLENEFYRVGGKIQLLKQQIETLEEKAKKKPE